MPSTVLSSTLPLELALLASSTPLPLSPLPALAPLLSAFAAGDYQLILTSPLASSILTLSTVQSSEDAASIATNYGDLLAKAVETSAHHPLELLLLGATALKAFLQATATGPPLGLTEATLLPPAIAADKKAISSLKLALVRGLSVDGESAYNLLPYPVLFSLAKAILDSPRLEDGDGDNRLATAPWWRVRVNLMHQRILREAAGSLHDRIYGDLATIEDVLLPSLGAGADGARVRALYLVERATVHTFYGYDVKVRKDLEAAAEATGLQYAITGRLGKRTKFQIDDLSQLVVLAKSREDYMAGSNDATDGDEASQVTPKQIDLNDDTLLDAINFKSTTDAVVEDNYLPASLRSLDPSSQPTLHPLDGVILLHLAESIKNTNPADGLTREEMAPYATRVLQHATNWSVHTMGLLVRSRLEAFRSRTVERSLLQLQVVVDQIVAATAAAENESGVSTFLPKPKEEESAGVAERLEYAFPLALPMRWEVEAELAGRWVSMGGLRTALEIYERLEMWAEAALCWASIEKEDKAREIVRKLLFEGEMPSVDADVDRQAADDKEDGEEEIVITDDEEKEPVERNPPPADAPRLWCILGDLEKKPEHYHKAWTVSGNRYARAQRSLGIYHLRRKEFDRAIEAYALSLQINPLNHMCWFQYGCALLEAERWDGAVQAFTRVVGIDDQDAEAWSNLATALLRQGKAQHSSSSDTNHTISLDDDDDDDDDEEGQLAEKAAKVNSNESKVKALTALKRAVAVRPDNWRLWENVLVIAASLSPPSWSDMQVAIRRVIDLRSAKAGESCIDGELLDLLVRHVITSSDTFSADEPGIARVVVELVEKRVVPLITADEKLWAVVRRLAMWRRRYGTALECQEKAFRVVSSRYDLRTDRKSWEELVEATGEMVDAYQSLGEVPRTEGLAAGTGEVVMRDWKFKARSVVRGVMGKGRKGGWDEDEGLWGKLEEMAESLKA
ncbi:hypothetical protein Dda_1189 [Drechslerella dactyloides]|uniref:TPR repeat-containing protein n=1 Tax=Drechslerella dactyloides TaxID=74499 RepID=A0AAD6J5V6_DREDA|nr:hypothetical protein Dda_1189 [Drechslerella dactyloides]